jgi:hypothetical protein
VDLIRRNLFLIICALATAGGIALGVTGLRSMDQVKEQMVAVEGLYRSLDGLQSQAVNAQRIEAEQERIRRIVEDRDAVVERGRRLYGYELLVPDVLPYGAPLLRIEYRRRYAQAMNDLQSSLTMGSPADPVLMSEMRDKIADEEAERQAAKFDPGATIRAPKITGPPRTPAGVLTTSGAAVDEKARANLAAAQRIYCYGVRFEDARPTEQRFPSLHIDSYVLQDLGTADPPLQEDVWRSQLSYWIQKDVVDVIAALNREAAEAAEKAGQDPWVGIMPVKDVISIRVPTEIVPLDGGGLVYGAPPGGTSEAFPPGSAETVFTHTGSGEAYEVIQFAVKLVMDERDIPLFVARLTNNRFHTLLRLSYEAVPINRDMIGRIYGSEPAVNVVLDFETILLGQVFRRWMPESIREQYGVRCREVDKCAAAP